ncbi:MAG: alpha/beta fold hydrolase [bacterium]|nr:alpha/beta fold hydrolase [bacterium]
MIHSDLRRPAKKLFALCFAAALGLFSLTTATCSSLAVSEVQPDSRFAADGAFFEWNGHQTYFTDRGRNNRETIVLIHGFGSSTYSWRHLIEPLSENYRVVAVDLLGFGFSDKPDVDYTMDLFSRQVLALLDHLEIRSAIFAGNSMGGKITLLTAVQTPERVDRMILIDAAAYPDGSRGRPFLLSLAAKPCIGEFLSNFNSASRVRGMLEDAYYDESKVADPDVQNYYAPLRMAGGSRAALSLLRSDDFGGDLAAAIPEIQIPALILWGAEDTWIPVENATRLHAELPRSQLIIFPGTGHTPQEESPELVLPAVQKYLAGPG